MSKKIKKMEPPTPRKEFGQFIHDKREKKEITQWDVAKEFKYTSAQFVSNWERGVSYPPLADVKELATIIGVKPIELVQRMKKAKQKEIEIEFAEVEKGMRK